jgi:hypothetical protein
MCNRWNEAYIRFNWGVDLRHFNGAGDYLDFFNRVIEPQDMITFEDRFRETIDGNGSFVIAGEVCFWKNYGNAQSRDRITHKLLNHLENIVNWNKFVQAVKRVQENPSYDNFINLRGACDQPKGFATPITFLAFYKPTEYPMVDKHIANWWAINRANFGYENSSAFSQRDDGWIPPKLQNWNAYIDWKKFCNDYIGKIRRRCGWNWRARDVEMAVWEASKNNIPLETL